MVPAGEGSLFLFAGAERGVLGCSEGRGGSGVLSTSYDLGGEQLIRPRSCECWGSPGGAVVRNPPANTGVAGDEGLILGVGRSPGRGHGNPLQYSCLGNPMDRGVWWTTVHVTVHGVMKELDTIEYLGVPPLASLSPGAWWWFSCSVVSYSL